MAAAHVVQHFACIGIKQQAVDGEVAALHVHARVFGELHFVRMTSVRVSAVAAESCDFNGVVVRLAFCSVAAHGNQHHTELRTYSKSLRKNADYFMRSSTGGNVIVGGLAIEQQVAHASADEIGGVAVFTQSARDADGFNRFFSREIHFVFYRKRRKAREEKQDLTADERG